MTTWQPPTPRDQGSASRRPTGARSAYDGRPRPMRARTDAELGERICHDLWKFAARTNLRGIRRDQAALALVRTRYPAARDVFSDQAIAAVLREVAEGSCHFCALRVLTAAADTAMPEQPTAALVALLGQPCRRCEAAFAEGEVADRERRLIAGGYRRRVTGPQPTGALWPAGREPAGLTAAAPSYYQPNPRRGPEPTVRDLINQARHRERQRERERE